LLIGYLGYKRPLSEGERYGVFMHGGGPSERFPAVHELFLLGSSSESALMASIADSENGAGIETQNALYTLLLIHHGDAVSVIRELRGKRASSASEERRRLEAAARSAASWCSEQTKPKCEDALSK
jgi:hypothetical protein